MHTILEYVLYVDTNAKVTNFLPFCTIGISMFQNVFYLIHYSLIIYPKLIPFWSVPYRQTNSSPLPKFFFFTEHAGPYPQAQPYWAGRTMTMGWMAD